MKKYVLILLVCACAMACKKKNSAPPAPAPPAWVDSPYFAVTINNINVATDSPFINNVSYVNDSGKYDVSIQALKTLGGVAYSINFYITNFTGVNTYPIAPPAVSAACYINGVRHYAQSGQIVIATDSNNVITGTFSFTADSITATKGAFNLQL